MDTGKPMRKRFLTAFLAVAGPALVLAVLAAFPLSRWIYMGIGGLIVIIALVVWRSLVAGLAEPAERLATDAEALISDRKSAGGYAADGEVVRVGQALAVYAKSLETLSNDLDRLIKNDIVGKRLDEAKYPAARGIAEKMNALLAAFDELHKQTTESVKSVMIGEAKSDLDKRAFVIDTELYNSVSSLTNYISGFVREVKRALEALYQGKTINIRDGVYDGQYLRLIETVESLSAGLSVFSAGAGNMAKGQARGDFMTRIDATSFPAMAELASNMNNTATSLEKMIGEVGDIFAAIKVGDYSVRYVSGSPAIDEKAQAACKALTQRNQEVKAAKPDLSKATKNFTPKTEQVKRATPPATVKPVDKTGTKTEVKTTKSSPVVSVLRSAVSDGSAEYNKKDFGKY